MISSDKAAGNDAVTSTAIASGLLERLKSGESAAWELVVDTYAPWVDHWCHRAGVVTDEAPDIAQEVFLVIIKRIGAFRCDRASDSFRGWLWTITQRKICDHFRRRKKQPKLYGGIGGYEQLRSIRERLPAADDSDPQAAELAERLVELLRPQVAERTWRAFWRLAVDEQSGRDVAAELGMTLQAVHQAKYRVLKRARRDSIGLLP